jgi:hypothetical protein
LERLAVVLEPSSTDQPCRYPDSVDFQALLTSGTASLSACALAASVVTVLFASAALENPLRRKGAVRLVLKARENIVAMNKEEKSERKEKRVFVGGIGKSSELTKIWSFAIRSSQRPTEFSPRARDGPHLWLPSSFCPGELHIGFEFHSFDATKQITSSRWSFNDLMFTTRNYMCCQCSMFSIALRDLNANANRPML